MPGLLVPILKGIAWAGGTAIGTAVLGRLLSTAAKPIEESAAQAAWAAWPVALPDVGTLMQAMIRGHVKLKDAIPALMWQGVNQGQRDDTENWRTLQRLWLGIENSMYVRPDISAAVTAMATGLIEDKDLVSRIFKQAGARRADWEPYRKLFLDQPTPAHAIGMYTHGFVSEKTAMELCTRFGGDWEEWEKFLQFLYRWPSLAQTFALWNRGIVKAEDARKYIQHGEGLHKSTIKEIEHLRYYMPPPSDLIMFAIREVFSADPEIDKALSEEFDEQKDLRSFFAAQGMAKIKVTPHGHPAAELDVPLAYWKAHWHWPSATQCYEMLHRLRPNRVNRLAVGNQIPRPFDVNDLNRVLKINDFVPLHRLQLAAISYRPPTRVDIRRMYSMGVIDEGEVRERYMDIGYSRSDAEDLTQFTIKLDERQKRAKKEAEERQAKREERTRTDKLRRRLIRLIWRGWLEGVIDWEVAVRRLSTLGLTLDEITTERETYILEAVLDRAERTRQRVCEDYSSGAITYELAEARLEDAGIRSDRIREILTDCLLMMSDTRRRETTNQIIQWYMRGLIDYATATIRLRRIGWADPEIAIQLAVANQDIQEQQIRALADAQKTHARQAKAIEAAIKKSQANIAKLRSQLRSHSSPARMQKWLRKGLIEPAQVEQRLQLLGWPSEDIQRYLREVNSNGDDRTEEKG